MDDSHEVDQLIDRLSTLLTGIANAVKGAPEPLCLHDWSDLPAVAAQVVAERAAGSGKADADP